MRYENEEVKYDNNIITDLQKGKILYNVFSNKRILAPHVQCCKIILYYSLKIEFGNIEFSQQRLSRLKLSISQARAQQQHVCICI